MNRNVAIIVVVFILAVVTVSANVAQRKAELQEQFPALVHDTSPVFTSRQHRQNSREVDILFIGNSYTFFNDMPRKLVAVADADTDSDLQLSVQMVARGGIGLKEQYEDSDAAGLAIQSRRWNYIVLQDQSFWAMFPESIQTTFTIMQNFDAMIRRTGAQTVLFLTWARQPGSHWYTDSKYSFLGSPDYMLRQFEDNTNAIGRKLQAQVVPVGDYWAAALASRPSLPLYWNDGTHPSPTGAYLNALIFYHHLTGRPVAQIAYQPPNVSPEDAGFLRNLVSKTDVAKHGGER